MESSKEVRNAISESTMVKPDIAVRLLAPSSLPEPSALPPQLLVAESVAAVSLGFADSPERFLTERNATALTDIAIRKPAASSSLKVPRFFKMDV
jgi:hypothetical protein